ncbi:MAG: hypothetical protein WCJ67_12530, partial [Thermoleophilia bacterium]
MVVRVLLLTVAALLLGGCGGKGNEQPASSVATETTGVATETAGAVLEGASTESAVGSAKVNETALLTGVRAARHEGYDR